MISRCCAVRGRTTNRNEWSSATTTDDTTAGYRNARNLNPHNTYEVLGSHRLRLLIRTRDQRAVRRLRGKVAWEGMEHGDATRGVIAVGHAPRNIPHRLSMGLDRHLAIANASPIA